MRTTAIINLKGGVGKTTTAINLSYQLYLMGKRVLLIDLDKQANVSKFYKIHSDDEKTVADVLLGYCSIYDCVHTVIDTMDMFAGCISVLPANMSLLAADKKILIDVTKPQQTRLSKALEWEKQYYDYCIIDCAPDINMSVINALVAADDVIIPVTIDQFSFDGINEVIGQIDDVRDNFNPRLKIGGCLVTQYKDTEFNRQGVEFLNVRMGGRVYDTMIKYSAPVLASTFEREPLGMYSPRSLAAKGYKAFADEYITGYGG